jgi:hypothetical protein
MAITMLVPGCWFFLIVELCNIKFLTVNSDLLPHLFGELETLPGLKTLKHYVNMSGDFAISVTRKLMDRSLSRALGLLFLDSGIYIPTTFTC